MNLPVLFGTGLTIAGLYALLTRRDAATDDGASSLADLLTSRTGTGYSLALTGLLILTAALSRPASWWSSSILAGSVPTGVYWLGVVALIGGALAVALADSDRSACGGMVLIGTGGALLFGLAGNVIAGIALIVAAAAAGWAAWARTATAERSLPSFPEPLLLSVATAGLLALTSAAVHRAATTENRLAETHETGHRTLPRPTVARTQVSQNAAPKTEADGSSTAIAGETPSTAPQPWHSLATYGLLIAVVSLGLWQQLGQRDGQTAHPYSTGDDS